MQFEKLQLKRGTQAKVAEYTGPGGELVVDLDDWTLGVHDGTTKGGKAINSASLPIATPEVLSPMDSESDVSATPTVQTSAFSGSGSHVASRYQFASDDAFGTMIHDSKRTTADLTSYSMDGSGDTLPAGELVYLRVWHESDDAGISEWSPTVSFTVIA